MKKNFFPQLLLVLFLAAFLIPSCGPSAEERRQQEIRDSIQLEEDRRRLIERANEMFSPAETDKDEPGPETATDSQTED